MAMMRILGIAMATIFLTQATAAVNHTVGAPGGGWDLSTNLPAWASTQTFTKGDNLVFSYNPSFHNVLEVTKANFDTCTASSPIKQYTTGNDVIQLSSEGTKYFICGIPGHCLAGMKVQINTVSSATSAPVSSPTPSSTMAVNHTVGASPLLGMKTLKSTSGGWDLSTNLAAWASTQTFTKGDNLVFSYNPSFHNVLEVTKADFDTCTASSPTKQYTSGKDVIQLSSAGTKYFICGVPRHCAAGMKIQINTVSTATSAPASSPSPSSTISPSASPMIAPSVSIRISPSASPRMPPSTSPIMSPSVSGVSPSSDSPSNKPAELAPTPTTTAVGSSPLPAAPHSGSNGHAALMHSAATFVCGVGLFLLFSM